MVGQPGTAPEHECNDCKQQRTRCQAADRGTGLNRLHQSLRTVRCSQSRIPALGEASNLTIIKWADGKLGKLSPELCLTVANDTRCHEHTTLWVSPGELLKTLRHLAPLLSVNNFVQTIE